MLILARSDRLDRHPLDLIALVAHRPPLKAAPRHRDAAPPTGARPPGSIPKALSTGRLGDRAGHEMFQALGQVGGQAPKAALVGDREHVA